MKKVMMKEEKEKGLSLIPAEVSDYCIFPCSSLDPNHMLGTLNKNCLYLPESVPYNRNKYGNMH